MAPPVGVSVGMLTYRRPDILRRGLESVLARLAEDSDELFGFEVDILVVDNDSARSALPVVEELASPVVRYVCEPRPGIGPARQRAIDECTDRDLLAFIDDDEIPRPGWLPHLLRTWGATGAAAVAGRVVPEYETALDRWIEAGRFFIRRDLPTGTLVESAPAGNLLLDLAQVRRLGLRFDDRFALSGGEDTLFTRQLRKRGGLIAFCRESEAVDIVPADRMTREWVLRRALSHGNTTALVEAALATDRSERARVRLAMAARGALRAGAGLARALAGSVSGNLTWQARGLRLAFRGAGILYGSVGRVHQEYARVAH